MTLIAANVFYPLTVLRLICNLYTYRYKKANVDKIATVTKHSPEPAIKLAKSAADLVVLHNGPACNYINNCF